MSTSFPTSADKPEVKHFTAAIPKITHPEHREKSGREGQPVGCDVEKMEKGNGRPGGNAFIIYFSTCQEGALI